MNLNWTDRSYLFCMPCQEQLRLQQSYDASLAAWKASAAQLIEGRPQLHENTFDAWLTAAKELHRHIITYPQCSGA